MRAKIYTEPTVEPVSLTEIKEHLRLDSGTFGDNLTTYQCIAPGSQSITAGYTLYGTGVDVLGYSAVVTLDSGTNGATGTVDVKIQESDDNVTFTDWTGGAFTQVTTANDNAVQEKEYTGTKQYIRVACRVLLAACVFGVQIQKYSSDTTEDTILTALITAARERAEAITRRALITQTWDAWLDKFPSANFFKLPFGKLQSVTSLAYKDDDGTETTMTVTTDYLVDSDSDPGRIVLPYGESWPSFTAYPYNPIKCRFVCGYGATSASVPAAIRTAIKMLVEDMYENRSARDTLTLNENRTVMALLQPYRLWDEF